MGNNSQNNWLSHILRPRASSISVESCLNLATTDPSSPLDARPIVPLLEATQPLTARCKHLATFSDICKTYKFTHLENIFFTVQDILDPTMPREARHGVFQFMLACIVGQYAELGMARVTFYSSLRNYNNWEDFDDMYRVLFALCKEGRDISGFEKNISKLLIHWLDVAIKQPLQQQQHKEPIIPYLSSILHLLTLVAKFNFALFEESEVTEMINATHRAFFASQHMHDRKACLEFTDIVVRYRFVPLDALTPFLDILASAVILIQAPNKNTSSWPIFLNLLRSHCAHNAVLTLCHFLDKQPSKVDAQNIQIKGAITLLGETAWSKAGNGNSATTSPAIGVNTTTTTTATTTTGSAAADMYTVSDSVILMYFRRAATKGNDAVNGYILKTLTLLLTSNTKLSLMEWDAVWDIVDVCTRHILKITDNNSNNDVHLFDTTTLSKDDGSSIYHFSQFSQVMIQAYLNKSYTGPVIRWMQVLYQLRGYCNDVTATILLDYYVQEHSLLPSTENWLKTLEEITTTFFIHATEMPKVRLAMLGIVADVCAAVKDFYSEVMYETIVIPMMKTLPSETDTDIRQTAIDLLVSSLSDCQSDSIFDALVGILKECAQCQCLSKKELESMAAAAAATTTTATSATSTPRLTHLRKPPPTHSNSSTTHQQQQPSASTKSFVTEMTHGGCLGVSAMCGLSDLFQNLLLASNGKLCSKTFDIITDIANDESDLFCPFGGPKLVALDLLLRFRCPTNHHIYLTDDNMAEEENSVIASIRRQHRENTVARENKRGKQFIPPVVTTNPITTKYPSPHVFSYNETPRGDDEVTLDMNAMLRSYVRVLSNSPNWVVVLFVLKRLPQQLSNKHLFCGASPYINKLRRRLVQWTSTRKFLENVVHLPPAIKRNDLNLYAYSLLTVLISYRRVFTEPKQDQDEIVYAFYVGIMQVTNATRLCINSLAVCCHEMPLSVAKMLNEILQRMSQIISVSSVSVHILEFLSGLARLPNLYANFTGDMYKPVFAIALNYLQHSQSQQQQQQQQVSPGSTPAASPMLPNNNNNNNASGGALKQYVLIMAYLVITVWFTAIPLRERRKHVPFIIQRLLSSISMGRPIDEQTYTCIDMLSRFTFADVSLAPEKSIVSKILMGDEVNTTGATKQNQRTWVYGHTLLTLRTAKALGWVEVMIRRPSGTLSMMCYIENKIKSDDIDYKTLPALLMMQYQPDLMAAKIIGEASAEQQQQQQEESSEEATAAAAVHEVMSEPPTEEPTTAFSSTNLRKVEPSIDPGFLYLQLNNYPDTGTGRSMDSSPPLPDDEATARSLATFDRIPVVDFHKIGVLYVGKGQKHELEILANTYGSPDYVRFLNALGTIQRLRGYTGNSGGLDREMDIDGKFAYFWRDDVTEAVFHIATLMPTHLDRDPQCSAKKRHIGNDYVSVVYNDSGADYVFDTLPSQFNFINIVVSPHSISTEAVSPSHALTGTENTFFKVEMQRRPDMPDIGPMSEPKLVSAQSLPGFVRLAAIHANIFAQVFWQSRAAGGQYVSHWRERLKQIKRIKERITAKVPNQQQQQVQSVDALLDFTKYT